MADITRVLGAVSASRARVDFPSTRAALTRTGYAIDLRCEGTIASDSIAHALPSFSELELARDRAALARGGRPRASVSATSSADLTVLASPIVHRFVGRGTLLITTPDSASEIARGLHQIAVVAGKHLDYPSQDLAIIESADPSEPGQTHVIARHVGSDLAANVARLRGDLHIRAAGGYTNLETAQFATDTTIANPANQKFLADFLADGSRSKDALYRVDLGRSVGASTLRSDLDAGSPTLRPATSANVVVVKDGSFPEGYRVLTSYPEATRGAQVDANGNVL